jgi:hypothetical protein
MPWQQPRSVGVGYVEADELRMVVGVTSTKEAFGINPRVHTITWCYGGLYLGVD